MTCDGQRSLKLATAWGTTEYAALRATPIWMVVGERSAALLAGDRHAPAVGARVRGRTTGVSSDASGIVLAGLVLPSASCVDAPPRRGPSAWGACCLAGSGRSVLWRFRAVGSNSNGRRSSANTSRCACARRWVTASGSAAFRTTSRNSDSVVTGSASWRSGIGTDSWRIRCRRLNRFGPRRCGARVLACSKQRRER